MRVGKGEKGNEGKALGPLSPSRSRKEVSDLHGPRSNPKRGLFGGGGRRRRKEGAPGA